MVTQQDIANLVVRLTADVSQLKTSFEQSSREVKKFAETNTGIIASLKSGWGAVVVAIAAVYSAYKALASVTETIKTVGMETYKLMKSTGMTAEEASGLIAVAEDLGVEFNAVAMAAVSIARKMGGLKDIESDVIDATGKSVDVFEKWGIVVK